MQSLIIGHAEAEKAEASGMGQWTRCPAFSIGTAYTLRVRNASDARLASVATRKPLKLEYLSSAPLPAPTAEPAPLKSENANGTATARVHFTSSPSGGEIYVDGKFFGNTPSDITPFTGEHSIKVTFGGKEWIRAVQITTGEIHLHAEISEK